MATMLLQGTPIEALCSTARKLWSAVQSRFGVSACLSRCLPIAMRTIMNHAKKNSCGSMSTATFSNRDRSKVRRNPTAPRVHCQSDSSNERTSPTKVARWATPKPAKTPSQSRSMAKRPRQRQQSMTAGDHPRPDYQRPLTGAPRRRSVRTL